MPSIARPWNSLRGVAIGGAALAFGGALMATGSEGVLSRQIGSEIASLPASPAAVKVADAPAPSRIDYDQSEKASLWLSRLEAGPAFGLTRAIKIGDRISIGGKGSPASELVVTEISELPGSSLNKTATEEPKSPRLLLVTCTEPEGAENRAAPRIVRFVIEAQPEARTAPTAHGA